MAFFHLSYTAGDIRQHNQLEHLKGFCLGVLYEENKFSSSVKDLLASNVKRLIPVSEFVPFGSITFGKSRRVA